MAKLEILIGAAPIWVRQKIEIEGPTCKQGIAMAAYRKQLLDQEAAAVAAGNDDIALDRGSEAWDIERDLNTYGLDLETGKPIRAKR